MLEEVDSISNEPSTYILDKETIIDGGSIKTNSITSNQILANSITADKIATDAIKSRNYISSGGTQGSFLNLSDGSFTSPNLSWDSNGNLIAKNANLSGEITATDGSIGKFKITDQWLTTGSGSTCAGLGGSGQAFGQGLQIVQLRHLELDTMEALHLAMQTSPERLLLRMVRLVAMILRQHI